MLVQQASYYMVLRVYGTDNSLAKASGLFSRTDAQTVQSLTLILVGEHLQEEFTKVSALKILPVIDDNGFILSER